MTILFVGDVAVGRFDSVAARWVLAADRMREVGDHSSVLVITAASDEAKQEFTDRDHRPWQRRCPLL